MEPRDDVFVVPAKAGIQQVAALDSGERRNDDPGQLTGARE
jgi:hypothetical protein